MPDPKKMKTIKAGAPRLKGCRSLSHPYGRRDSDAHSIASSTDFSDYSSYSSASSSSYVSMKQEEQEFPSALLLQQLHLQYPEDSETSVGPAASGGAYLHPYDFEDAQDSGVHEQPPLSATSTTSSLSFWSGYESPHPPTQSLAPVSAYPTFHAPRPLRYSQSLPFLPTSERRISCPADVIARPRSTEPIVEVTVATTVDPRMLTQQHHPDALHDAHGLSHPQELVSSVQAVHANQWYVVSFDATHDFGFAKPWLFILGWLRACTLPSSIWP